MIPFCRETGVGLIPWSPLARGFLTGNRTKDRGGPTKRSKSDDFAHRMYYQDDDFAVVERVVELAEREQVTPAQVALGWLLHQPGIAAPIIGASKIGHLEEAVAAAEIDLSEEDIVYLAEPYQPHPVLGHG